MLKKRFSLGLILAVAFAVSAYAAITFQTGGGTGDLTEWTATTGTASNATDQAYTGTHSFKGDTGAGPTAVTFRKDAVLADAGRRINFRFRTDAWPDGGGDVVRVQTNSGSGVFQMQKTAGAGNKTLSIINASGGSLSCVGTTALSTNTWYRLTVSYSIINTSTFTIKEYVDGNLECSASGTLVRTGSDRLTFVTASALGANAHSWYDDIYVDDTTNSSDPGNIPVSESTSASGASLLRGVGK